MEEGYEGHTWSGNNMYSGVAKVRVFFPLKSSVLLKNERALDLSQHGIPFSFSDATF